MQNAWLKNRQQHYRPTAGSYLVFIELKVTANFVTLREKVACRLQRNQFLNSLEIQIPTTLTKKEVPKIACRRYRVPRHETRGAERRGTDNKFVCTLCGKSASLRKKDGGNLNKVFHRLALRDVIFLLALMTNKHLCNLLRPISGFYSSDTEKIKQEVTMFPFCSRVTKPSVGHGLLERLSSSQAVNNTILQAVFLSL